MFAGVKRKTTERTIKSLKIALKMLAKGSNVMWDILLANEEDATNLTCSIIAAKSV